MGKKIILFVALLIGFISISNFSFALDAQGRSMVREYGPIPKEITHPDYQKEAEGSALENIVYRFFRIFASVHRRRGNYKLKACFANQRVLLGATEMYNMDHKIMLKKVTDAQACDKYGELVSGGYLKRPLRKPDSNCGYMTYGDLTGSGVIYCKHHGAVTTGAGTFYGVKVKYKEPDEPSHLYAAAILILGPLFSIALVIFTIKGLKSSANTES
jgi:hypothetical protein